MAIAKSKDDLHVAELLEFESMFYSSLKGNSLKSSLTIGHQKKGDKYYYSKQKPN